MTFSIKKVDMRTFTAKYRERVESYTAKVVPVLVEAADEAARLANRDAKQEYFISVLSGSTYFSWLGLKGVGLAFDMAADKDRSMIPRATTTQEIVKAFIFSNISERHRWDYNSAIRFLDYLEEHKDDCATLQRISRFEEFKGSLQDLEKLLEEKRKSLTKPLPSMQAKLNLES